MNSDSPHLVKPCQHPLAWPISPGSGLTPPSARTHPIPRSPLANRTPGEITMTPASTPPPTLPKRPEFPEITGHNFRNPQCPFRKFCLPKFRKLWPVGQSRLVSFP